MAIVGFNFTKINVEKTKALTGKINISNNVSITNVEESKLGVGDKQKGLQFGFEFVSNYEPKMGSIKLEGDVVLLLETAKAEEIMGSWKKDKKIPKEIMTSVLNTALNRCNIQALILSQQVNLPSPIPMPKVEAKAEEAEK